MGNWGHNPIPTAVITLLITGRSIYHIQDPMGISGLING